MWQLVINGPGYFDTHYDLPEGVTNLGRADENDVVLSGDLVSRRHATLRVSGDALSFEDLGSRNGSAVNSVLVTAVCQLRPGDSVTVGENTITIRQPADAESRATERVDTGGGGTVKRFGRGAGLAESVVVARDLNDSAVLRALDNLRPLANNSPAPIPTPAPTRRADAGLAQGPASEAEAAPVAWQSLALLYRVAQRLATAPSLQAFLDETIDLVMQRVSATTGVVLLRHASGVLVPAAVRHASRLRQGEVPVSDAIVEAALAQGRALAVADALDDSRFAQQESVVLYGLDQVLCIPIGAQAPALGVLYLNRSGVSQEPVEALLDVCTAITQLLESGVQKFNAHPVPDDRLRRGLERFLGPESVERRLPELKQHGPAWLEERRVTVLVADLGFSQQLPKLDGERVGELLSEFVRVATQLCMSFDGTVLGVQGDVVTALFGTPYSRGDDALRAVRSALALKAEWERSLARRPARERPKARVGLTTGTALTGTVGTEARLDAVALGEPVNVATWLCASADPGQLLVTSKCLAALGARFDVTPLGERPLNGSKARTPVFEVLDEDNDSGTLSGFQ